MRRPARYSPSPKAQPSADTPAGEFAPAGNSQGISQAMPQSRNDAPVSKAGRWQPGRGSFALLLALTLALACGVAWMWPQGAPRALTQKDIDAAVLRTLATHTLPSPTTRAAEAIAPSLVRVVGYGPGKKPTVGKADKRGRKMPKDKADDATASPDNEEDERGVGTGVVIVDSGVILTNLHVVAGAERIKVTFHDGTEADASITGVQPENDLAVLQAKRLPDDLIAATMRSTADLRPGDQVAAVGFPFGIGPSVSSGVVSGLKRAFRSPEGKQELGNLIQFDAAANPGNSGGPLVNMDGEVLGIVTAILNPTQQRTFIGIGFAVPIENAASAAGSPPF